MQIRPDTTLFPSKVLLNMLIYLTIFSQQRVLRSGRDKQVLAWITRFTFQNGFANHEIVPLFNLK